MVCPGQNCPRKATPLEIAQATVRVLLRTVPPAVPGICFLSGGQSEDEATANLAAINHIPSSLKPWRLTFSYARALQNSVLKTWGGRAENEGKAQRVLVERARLNSEASLGKNVGGFDSKLSAAEESLFEKDYRY